MAITQWSKHILENRRIFQRLRLEEVVRYEDARSGMLSVWRWLISGLTLDLYLARLDSRRELFRDKLSNRLVTSPSNKTFSMYTPSLHQCIQHLYLEPPALTR